MKRLLFILRDTRAASAAEFALIIPVLLVAIVGTIDVGRYGWALAMSEKATQAGARFAVATDLVAANLGGYSFAKSGEAPQGTVVNSTLFPGIRCYSNDTGTTVTTATCECLTAGGCTNFGTAANPAALNRVLERMRQMNPDIRANNIMVTYAWSGLGFAGDPNGPDVAPLTTVSLRNFTFSPATLLVFRAAVNVPQFAYTLPMEDGSGTSSN